MDRVVREGLKVRWSQKKGLQGGVAITKVRTKALGLLTDQKGGQEQSEPKGR